MKSLAQLSGQGAAILLCFTALTISCQGSRTLEVLPSEESNLGGASNEPSTGGVSGEDPPGTGGAPGSVLVIDDFADCDRLITTTAGRSGSWYYFAEPAVNLNRVIYTSGPAPDASWGTQQCGIYLTGGCPSCVAAGVGFELAPEGWDLSGYRGIRVSFESETSLWSVIVSIDGEQIGYSEYVELLPTGGMSAERILYFDDIYPGNGFQGLAVARHVQFTVGEEDRASFGFGIHRVELVE